MANVQTDIEGIFQIINSFSSLGSNTLLIKIFAVLLGKNTPHSIQNVVS